MRSPNTLFLLSLVPVPTPVVVTSPMHAIGCKDGSPMPLVAAVPAPHPCLEHAGELDRSALGLLVFNDTAARRRLNAATHAPVAIALLQQLAGYWLKHTPCVVSKAVLCWL